MGGGGKKYAKQPISVSLAPLYELVLTIEVGAAVKACGSQDDFPLISTDPGLLLPGTPFAWRLRDTVVPRTPEIAMNAVVRKVTRVAAPLEAEVATESIDFSADLTPEEKETARKAAQVVVASAVKGALNRIDPARYPIEDDDSSLDAQMAAAISRLPAKALLRIKPRVTAIAEGAQKVKLLDGIDPDSFRKSGTTLKVMERGRLTRPKLKAPEGDVEVRQGSGGSLKYKKAILELRAIHCVQETGGGGSDEIVFGGVLIGATGNTNPIEAFDAGDFDSGTYADFGAKPIGKYNLKNVEGYPSYLYAIFMLVESDSDDQAVADSLTDTIGAIAVTAAAFWSGGTAALAVYAIYEAIDGLINALFGPDVLRPYGIRLNLNSNDPFGKPISSNLRTGNITGEGATYRIGYRWVLSA